MTVNGDQSVEINNEISLCEGQDEICCRGKRGTPTTIRSPLACGTRHPNGLGATSTSPQDGDESTNFGEWPFTCLIYRQDDTLVGGATLIAPGFVLTAAHNVEDDEASDIRVHCGIWDIGRRSNLRAPQARDVESISIHPQYNPKQLYHDLALLHLEEDFELQDHIGTICLPSFIGDREDFEFDGCVVTGWGDRAELDPDDRPASAQPIMKAVHGLPIWEHDDCEQTYKGEVSSRFRLHDSFICAGGEAGIDACSGDGGGPLACPVPDQDNRYVLAGIVVGGIGCGKEGIPGIYASVEKDLGFIHWATQCKYDPGSDRIAPLYSYPQFDDWMDNLQPTLRLTREKEAAQRLIDACGNFGRRFGVGYG